MNSNELLQAATERRIAGDLSAAGALYRQIRAAAPDHAEASFWLGLLEAQQGRMDAGMRLIEQACAASPQNQRYRFALGQIYQASQRWPQAAAIFELIIQGEPADVQALRSLGHCRQKMGECAAAAAAYRRVLGLEPNDADTMANLGSVLRDLGELDAAVPLLRTALKVRPQFSGFAVNLGVTLIATGEFAEAQQHLAAVVAREPHYRNAAYNLGAALENQGRFADAAAAYRLELAARPDHVEALIGLGNAHRVLGELSQAESAYVSALKLRPQDLKAMNNLAITWIELQRLDAAGDLLLRALQIHAGHAGIHDNLATVLKNAGCVAEAIDRWRLSLQLNPDSAPTHSSLAYALSFQAQDPAPILAEAQRWNARFAAGIEPLTVRRPEDLNPERRLRIGYVSPDFRDHCQSAFTIPLLAHHDHSQFEIFAYSSVDRRDELTKKIQSLVDVWREVRHLNDLQLAHQIAEDGVDILVDLTMHMAGNRLLTFAHRPAPIQLSWLAYPGTTGLAAIDYRLTDPYLDPAGSDAHYAENSVRLPDSFWCYAPLSEGPAVNELPALKLGKVTFGCLNNPCKLTDATLSLWCDVLRALPTSALKLLVAPGRSRERLQRRFETGGVSSERLEFVGYLPREEYMRVYHRIDIGLDTFPYNGHTTTLDSLWMGVPVVTRVGSTCVGRGGLSQLSQIGLHDLAAETNQQFVDRAVALAGELPRLAELRRGLRSRLQASPLMNAERFSASIENVYRSIWRDYCDAGNRGQPGS